MPRLFAVSFITANSQTYNPRHIDQAFANELDWMRFSSLQWFVWTNKSRDELVNTIFPYTSLTENFMVYAVQNEAAEGRAQSWIWEWMNDKMQKQLTGRD